MQNVAELRLNADALKRYGLPDIAYPISAAELQSSLRGNSELPLAVMLHGLQQRSKDGDASWQSLEPAMDRLAELLAPDDTRTVISVEGDTWWLELGPVDLGTKLVTIQRSGILIAAISGRDDGRLRVAAYCHRTDHALPSRRTTPGSVADQYRTPSDRWTLSRLSWSVGCQ